MLPAILSKKPKIVDLHNNRQKMRISNIPISTTCVH